MLLRLRGGRERLLRGGPGGGLLGQLLHDPSGELRLRPANPEPKLPALLLELLHLVVGHQGGHAGLLRGRGLRLGCRLTLLRGGRLLRDLRGDLLHDLLLDDGLRGCLLLRYLLGLKLALELDRRLLLRLLLGRWVRVAHVVDLVVLHVRAPVLLGVVLLGVLLLRLLLAEVALQSHLLHRVLTELQLLGLVLRRCEQRGEGAKAPYLLVDRVLLDLVRLRRVAVLLGGRLGHVQRGD